MWRKIWVWRILSSLLYRKCKHSLRGFFYLENPFPKVFSFSFFLSIFFLWFILCVFFWRFLKMFAWENHCEISSNSFQRFWINKASTIYLTFWNWSLFYFFFSSLFFQVKIKKAKEENCLFLAWFSQTLNKLFFCIKVLCERKEEEEKENNLKNPHIFCRPL